MVKRNWRRSGNGPRRRSPGKYVTTRSGRVLKVQRSLGERWTAMKEGKSLRKVSRLRGLPKSRVKRFFWRLNPRRSAEYWFSRDGAIAAIVSDMGFDPALAEGLFIIARVAGLVAHVHEEISADGGLRRLSEEETEYIGHAKRDL